MLIQPHAAGDPVHDEAEALGRHVVGSRRADHWPWNGEKKLTRWINTVQPAFAADAFLNTPKDGYWNAVKEERGIEADGVRCTSCGLLARKSDLEWIGEIPVQSHTSSGSNRIDSHEPTTEELALIDEANQTPVPYWVPDFSFGPEREMWRAAHRAMGINTVAGFFTIRNLHGLSALRHAIANESDGRVREALMFAFTASVNRASKRYQWNTSVGGKSISEYTELMARSFEESARVLKRGGRAVLAFSNSDDRIWNSIQEALILAGYETDSRYSPYNWSNDRHRSTSYIQRFCPSRAVGIAIA
jgi:hypothetical protein